MMALPQSNRMRHCHPWARLPLCAIGTAKEPLAHAESPNTTFGFSCFRMLLFAADVPHS